MTEAKTDMPTLTAEQSLVLQLCGELGNQAGVCEILGRLSDGGKGDTLPGEVSGILWQLGNLGLLHINRGHTALDPNCEVNIHQLSDKGRLLLNTMG